MASQQQDIARRLRQARTRTADDLTDTLRRHGESLPDLSAIDEFGAMYDRFAAAQVVLLGEATHGTSEFYRARAAITQRLLEQHGFSVVAVEADWPASARTDAYAGRLAPRPRR